MPIIGRVAGQGGAYGYLVRSVKGYPGPDRIAEIMREAGLRDVTWQGMSGGIVTLHVGTVPDRAETARACRGRWVGFRVHAGHSPTPSLIHARGLTKRFGEFVAVDAIDFDVAPGESFGFLGPNGAGKTSTMRMIGCVSPISDGVADGHGHGPQDPGAADPGQSRRRAPAGHARRRADRPREPRRSTAATSG